MGRHRLTAKKLYSDDVRFIDAYGDLHWAGRQLTNSYLKTVELGELWEEDPI